MEKDEQRPNDRRMLSLLEPDVLSRNGMRSHLGSHHGRSGYRGELDAGVPNLQSRHGHHEPRDLQGSRDDGHGHEQQDGGVN